MSLLELPATELASRIRRREADPVEVLAAHIRRIEEVDDALNAVVVRRFADAREEALEARARLDDGDEVGPLHGVPCTIKEFIAFEGLPQTGGVVAREGTLAVAHAPIVDRIRAAGAIVMGTTNAPEGGLWHETHNKVYGRTSNPHDLYRSSGGSSGGEGAIIAAGGSPFGLGSDVGGSIRIPAAFCGVFGHKPTCGVVPNTGHFPTPPAKPYMVCGPLARSARDLMPLMRILAGPDGQDEQCGPSVLGDPDAVDLGELVVHVVPTNGRASVRPEVQAAVVQAGRMLQARGATVETLELPSLARSFELWAVLMGDVGMAYRDIVNEGEKIRLRRQFARWARGNSRHTGAVLAMVAIDRIMSLLPDRAAPMYAHAEELRAELDALLGTRGILLHPAFARLAPKHRRVGIGNPADVGVTAVFNILGNPATVAPVGFHRGLPTSVQIVGNHGADHVCIAAAVAIEDAVGPFRPVEPRYGRRPRFQLA